MNRTHKTNPVGDLVFQPIQWFSEDVSTEDDDGNPTRAFLIRSYGVTSDGHSIVVNIKNFTPYFFIKVDHVVTQGFLDNLEKTLIDKMSYKSQKKAVLPPKLRKRKDFWGFHNDEKFSYVQLTFTTLSAFRAAIRVMKTPLKLMPKVGQVKYTLYESNIEPMLRFMHIRDISPTGWASVPVGEYEVNEDEGLATCQMDVCCDWNMVTRVDKDKIAPFVIASFDLECSSSHGDFPVPCKDYKKVAYQLLQAFNEGKLSELNIVEEVMAIFDHSQDGILSKVFPKRSVDAKALKSLREKVTGSNDEMMRMLRGLLVYYPEKDMIMPPRSGRKVNKDDILKCLTRHLGMFVEKIDDTKTYGNKTYHVWSGIFPELHGDQIIQIGTTVHVYGEQECSFKSIITLGTCDPIEGVEVQACTSEEEMMMKWRELIQRLDPDVITGYNIFGFDFWFLHERAKELRILEEFSVLGRVEGKSCPYVEKNLSSSALGDNVLKMFDMDGRVLIDIIKVVQRDHKLDSFKLDNVANHFMGLNKHDVSPNDIFSLFRQGSGERKVIAEYCIQDCALCNKLMMKLEIMANNIGMSNVCNVPLSYIFMRGQGVKIFSLVSKQCREEGFLIPTITPRGRDVEGEEPEEEDEDGYEGAIVLPPKHGIYLEDPVSVLDYASLYPSSMISENLSHDCLVMDEKYNNLPGVEYLDISYDVYEVIENKKTKVGEKVCRFMQPPNGEKGVIPRILMKLLKARKDTRKKMEYKTVVTTDGNEMIGLLSEDDDTIKLKRVDGTSDAILKNMVASTRDTYDEFEQAVLDGLQLAYKVTANSLYGQIGAKTSPIYLKEIAACTTATGRKMICMARDFILENFKGATIVYGDTDSLFVKFDIRDSENKPIKGKEAIMPSIHTAMEASSKFKACLKAPHELEYEKTFFPFILFSKKRYCANKYEFDDIKHKRNSMGIVLKRRDNAPIVKHVYGGIIDIILNEQNIPKSVQFLKSSLEDLIAGKFPLESLVITKSLRADYKDPEKIAHKVLAERMGERDPGNKPLVNDRIPFVYIETLPGQKSVLQGERIEHPDYIKKQCLKPDYEFYITNQIMKPVLQLYALTLETLQGYKHGKDAHHFKNIETKLMVEKGGDVTKVKDRLGDLREAQVRELLFEPLLMRLKAKKSGNRTLEEFFVVKKRT